MFARVQFTDEASGQRREAIISVPLRVDDHPTTARQALEAARQWPGAAEVRVISTMTGDGMGWVEADHHG